MSLFGGKREEGEVTELGRAAAMATSAPRTDAPQPPSQRGETVANIGKSISIKGDLTGNEDMVIEGKVEGKVELPNNQLTIGAHGTVKAEVAAKSVVVMGHVVGNVAGTERVEIQATGRVEGDVAAPKLVVAEGAQINGTVQMGSAPGKVATPPPPAPNTDVRKAV